jgi:Pentapeptide repeats (8 copies)
MCDTTAPGAAVRMPIPRARWVTVHVGRTSDDVVRWPADQAARKALADYLAELSPDSRYVTSTLDAQDLDLTGADLSGLELAGAVLFRATLTCVSLVGTWPGRRMAEQRVAARR